MLISILKTRTEKVESENSIGKASSFPSVSFIALFSLTDVTCHEKQVDNPTWGEHYHVREWLQSIQLHRKMQAPSHLENEIAIVGNIGK